MLIPDFYLRHLSDTSVRFAVAFGDNILDCLASNNDRYATTCFLNSRKRQLGPLKFLLYFLVTSLNYATRFQSRH